MAGLLRRTLKGLALALGGLVAVALVLTCYVLVAWDRPLNRAVVPMVAPRTAEAVARGEHLYKRSALCWDCHASQGSRGPEAPQAGGREFDLTGIGPGFGYFYGSNLTPDPATGVGSWSDGELVRAIREGVNRKGKVIFPVMAYPFYHGLGDDDALAIVAYLRSLKPIERAVPERRPSFITKSLITFGVVAPEPAVTTVRRAPARARTAEYGEYLAWHASGCAECHTPRDPRNGKVDPSRPLAGGLFPFPEEGFTTTGPNLTPDTETGLGSWTEEQLVAAVRSGVRPDGTVMLPFMPWPSYGQWSDDDLGAVWLYLRSLKPVTHAVARGRLTGTAVDGRGLPRGRALFRTYCSTCHGEDGVGGPLTSTVLGEVVRSLDRSTVSTAVAEGIPGTAMPAFAKTFSADQLTDLVAFVAQLSGPPAKGGDESRSSR